MFPLSPLKHSNPGIVQNWNLMVGRQGKVKKLGENQTDGYFPGS